MTLKSVKDKKEFIRYGKFDTIEHAKNGLNGKDAGKIAKARVDLYNVHKKAKNILHEH